MGGEQSVQKQDTTGLSSQEHYFGFKNFGNTCYVNSVLQALYFCAPFRKNVLKNYKEQILQQPNKIKTTKNLLIALGEVFHEISTNKSLNGIYQPKNFINTLRQSNEIFGGLMHQDAHEFLNYLLNEISEILEKNNQNETNSTTPNISSGSHKTFVHSVFEGLLTNETRCLCCETVTSREESFLDLSIDVEKNSSISRCLRNFSSVETLSGADKFFCDVCCNLQEAEKRMLIKHLPDTLVVHLKRFKYNELLNRNRMDKVSHRVVFPFELKLPNTSADNDDPERLYELFAIVVHVGHGTNHGHYIAIIKSFGNWVHFDDERFKKVSSVNINKYFGSESDDFLSTNCGYLLFYQTVEN